MDEYIQKYLDGDLSEDEAASFAKALAQDTALDAELRAYERMLATATQEHRRDPSPRFTDQVMERVSAPAPAPVPSPGFARRLFGSRPWGLRAALAAGFVAVFMVGYLAPRPDTSPPAPAGPSGTTGVTQAAVVMPVAQRLARLVYAPENPEIGSVSVAGTFNGWDPDLTTMTRHGDVWVVQILLPPQTYEYMFVEDGERWVTDPLAPQTRDDGFGRKNAVLDLQI
jgi:hypothetical protein